MLQEDLLKILPMINEANAMSEELNKKVCKKIRTYTESYHLLNLFAF